MTGSEKDALTRTEDALACALDGREGLWWVRVWVLGLAETGRRPEAGEVQAAVADCERAWRGMGRAVAHLQEQRGAMPSGRGRAS